jgi:hypothetical protein
MDEVIVEMIVMAMQNVMTTMPNSARVVLTYSAKTWRLPA